MLFIVVGNYASEPDSWVSFYGIYDDPLKAEDRIKEVIKEQGNSCEKTDYNGWPAYQSDTTLYYMQEVEINKGMGIY